MNRKGKNYYLIVSLIILIMGIGFAYLSSNLTIRGLIGYSASSWDVHFENVLVTRNLIGASAPVIDNNKTTISFSGNFKEPSEYYEFCVDVVNAGTMDVMVDEIIKTGITNDNKDYFDFVVKYYNDTEINKYDLLSSGNRSRIIVRVEYKYNVNAIPDLDSEMNFSLALTYVKANSQARSVNSDNFTNSNKSNVFKLNNAKINSLFDLKIYGNTEQTTYTGQNLYNYEDVSSDIYATTNGAVADEDGWITMSYDNTQGSSVAYSNYFTNSLNVDINKTYSVVMEVKSVSGSDEIVINPTSVLEDYGQLSSRGYTFDKIKNKSVVVYTTTPRSNYNGLQGIRTYALFPIGTSGSITFRLSVIEGTDVTEENFVYEPYVGGMPSPNADYPQEVKSVTGNTELKITGKNLLNYTNIGSVASQYGITVDENGYISDNSPLNDGRDWFYQNSNFFAKLDAGTYTLSFKFSKQTNQANNYDVLSVFTESNSKVYQHSLHGINELIGTFTLTEPTNIGILAKSYEGIYKIQLEEGNTATEWEPYSGKTHSIALGNIELNGIDDYRDYIYKENDKWYIYKIINKLTLDGSEYWLMNYETHYFHTNNNLLLSNVYPYSKGFSSHFIFDERTQGIIPRYSANPIANNHYALQPIYKSIFIRNDDISTAADFKDWISNNHVDVYYPIDNSEKIEITDTNLINQLNAIYNDNLYNGINKITFTSNIDTDIEFNYIQK